MENAIEAAIDGNHPEIIQTLATQLETPGDILNYLNRAAENNASESLLAICDLAQKAGVPEDVMQGSLDSAYFHAGAYSHVGEGLDGNYILQTALDLHRLGAKMPKGSLKDGLFTLDGHEQYMDDKDRARFRRFDQTVQHKSGDEVFQEMPMPQGPAGSDLVRIDKCVRDPQSRIPVEELRATRVATPNSILITWFCKGGSL